MSILTFIIVCPLVFLAGFVDAVAGGGGLISLPAYTFAGIPMHTAIATNKLSSSMGTAVATSHFIRQGYIRLKLVIPGIITAFIGAVIGANLSLIIKEDVLKMIMIVLLPVIAFYVLRSKNLESGIESELSVKKTIFLCSMVSLFVGVYDGFYGPGTGTFLLLLFTGICHISLQHAAGTTKAINLTTNIVSLVIFLMNSQVLIPLGLVAGICNMFGGYLGSHCFSSKGATWVKPVILIVLVIFFMKTLSELCGFL